MIAFTLNCITCINCFTWSLKTIELEKLHKNDAVRYFVTWSHKSISIYEERKGTTNICLQWISLEKHLEITLLVAILFLEKVSIINGISPQSYNIADDCQKWSVCIEWNKLLEKLLLFFFFLFSPATLLKRRPLHRCFSVNFARSLTPPG